MSESGPNFEWAPSDQVESLRPYVNRVLEAVGYPAALVTDESMIGDFTVGRQRDAEAEGLSDDEIDRLLDREIALIGERLGLEVTGRDYVVDIARRLKKLEATDG
jgi:hypothetical protein